MQDSDLFCNCLNLAQQVFGKCLHCHAGSGGLTDKILFVDRVKGREVIHIGQKAGCLDHMIKVGSGCRKNRAHVLTALLSLDFNRISGHDAGFRNNGYLPRGENNSVQNHPLRIRSDRGGRIQRFNHFHNRTSIEKSISRFLLHCISLSLISANVCAKIIPFLSPCLLIGEFTLDNNNFQIGKIIKGYRTSRRLSVKELASASQITSSMLSQIERGQANPSLNTLRTLATVLDVPLFCFFVEDIPDTSDIVHPSGRKRIVENGVEYELLTKDMNCTIEFCQLTLLPGNTTENSSMSHKGEEVAIVIQGRFMLSLNGNLMEMNAGDSIRINPMVNHYWFNNSSEKAVLIFAVSPPSF